MNRYELYLMDVCSELRERAEEAEKLRRGAQEGTENYFLESARFFALVEVLSLLYQQACSFGIEPEVIGLPQGDPETDLLNR